MEGKVTKDIQELQWVYLASKRTRLTVDSWMKGFVCKLIEMTHKQWIFCCVTKHHMTKGTRALANQQDLLNAIEEQLKMGAKSLAPEDQWMLELDQNEINSKSARWQQYWLWAVEAARTAGRNAERITKGKTTSWKNIMEDDRFDYLPTYVEHLSEDEDEDEEKDKEEKEKPVSSERAKPSAPKKEAPAKAGKTVLTKLAPIFKASVLAAASSRPARNKAKKRGGLNSSRYGSLVRPPPVTQVPSREALRKDRLGIFSLVASLNNLAKERLRAALTPPPILRRTITGAIISDPVFINA